MWRTIRFHAHRHCGRDVAVFEPIACLDASTNDEQEPLAKLYILAQDMIKMAGTKRAC